MHATTMKTKRHYTTPVTQRATVELEGGFCGSIMDKSNAIEAEGHTVGGDYDFSNPGTDSEGNANFSVKWE